MAQEDNVEMWSINSIDFCQVLHLRKRDHDRRPMVDKELNDFFGEEKQKQIVKYLIGEDSALDGKRKMTNGNFGKYKGHLAALAHAIREDAEYFLMVEDDLKFTNVEKFKEILTRVMNDPNTNNFDVLMFSGISFNSSHIVINQDCIRVTDCETSGCYLVKKNYIQVLKNHLEQGLNKLKDSKNYPNDNPTPEKTFNFSHYALDKHWKVLQKKHLWYMCTPLLVVQENTFSDVILRDVDRQADMQSLTTRKAPVKASANQKKANKNLLRQEGQQEEKLEKYHKEYEKDINRLYGIENDDLDSESNSKQTNNTTSSTKKHTKKTGEKKVMMVKTKNRLV